MKEQKDTAIFIAYEDSIPPEELVPEKELLVAVLLSALSDLDRPGEDGKRAKEYFLSSEDDYIFSFKSICGYLNISPNKILTVVGLPDFSKRDLTEVHDEVVNLISQVD